MTSFGWKRKIERDKGREVSKIFLADDSSTTGDGESGNGDDVDWLSNARRSRVYVLESATVKSERLKDEGCILADAERFWEALKRWDEALRLNPNDSKLYEMKAQAYLALHEIFPAVQAAEMAVKENPTWWVAYQTLGRTQLGFGEVKLALQSFCKALHLQPDAREIWDDDISWAQSLLRQHEKMSATEVHCKMPQIKIKELESVSSNIVNDCDHFQNSEENQSQEHMKLPKSLKTFNKTQSWVKLRH